MTVQTEGSMPPPYPPTRTAVAADTPERRPCATCGHTLTQHLAGSRTSRCSARNRRLVRQGDNVQWQWEAPCQCDGYREGTS